MRCILVLRSCFINLFWAWQSIYPQTCLLHLPTLVLFPSWTGENLNDWRGLQVWPDDCTRTRTVHNFQIFQLVSDSGQNCDSVFLDSSENTRDNIGTGADVDLLESPLEWRQWVQPKTSSLYQLSRFTTRTSSCWWLLMPSSASLSSLPRASNLLDDILLVNSFLLVMFVL